MTRHHLCLSLYSLQPTSHFLLTCLSNVMRRWVGARMVITNRLRHFPARPFCSTDGGGAKGPISKYEETYGKLDKLDFMTAAKILFTSPPKTNKFGFDFHLVQFFFACMPSLAVYLVAQYSRYEMRRMEADLEKKRKAEEEAKAKEDELKAKEDELKAIEEKENNPVIQDLSKVNVRLDKLEEAVKEIVVESKKQLSKISTKRPNDSTERKDDDATKNGKMDVKSEKNSLEEKDQNSKGKSETLAPRSDQVDSNS